MTTNNIQIMNLSCRGCVNTITRNLMAVEGVTAVDTDLDTNIVSVTHEANVFRENLVQLLFSLGYPEVNETNSFITKLKSRKSCIIGRMS